MVEADEEATARCRISTQNERTDGWDGTFVSSGWENEYHELNETHEPQQSNHLLNGENPERAVLPIALCFRQNRQLGDEQMTRTERFADSIHERPKTHFEPEWDQIGDRIDFFAPLAHRFLAIRGDGLFQSFPNELRELRMIRRSDERRRRQRHHRFEMLANVRIELLFRSAMQSLLINEVRVVNRRRLEGPRRLDRQGGQDFFGENRPSFRFDRLQHLQFLVKSVRIHGKGGIGLIGIAHQQLARRGQRRRERNRRRIQRETMQHGHERVVEIAKKLLVERPRRGGKNHRGERTRAEFAGGRWLDGGNELVGGDFAMIVDECGGYGARIVEFLSHPVFHTVIFVENDEGNVWEKTDVAASHLHIERLSKGNQRGCFQAYS